MTFSKTISESDVYLFASITGDLSPNHVDEEYMRKTRYGRHIAHGALALSLMSNTSPKILEGLPGTWVRDSRCGRVLRVSGNLDTAALPSRAVPRAQADNQFPPHRTYANAPSASWISDLVGAFLEAPRAVREVEPTTNL